MTGLLPEAGLRLNPDAPHPPFPWHVALPSDWAILDTHPSSWQRSAERLVDEQMLGQRMKSAERRAVLTFMDDLVASCQRAGTLVSLVRIGRLTTGAIGSAGLHLAWYDSTPEEASLATVRRAAGRQGLVEEIETDAGTVILQRDRLRSTVPGGNQQVGLISLQAFLPLTGRCWTAVVATACAHPEMQTVLQELVLAVVGSIQPLDRETATTTSSGADEDQPHVTYSPVETVTAPGIERGFGTMLVHRIDRDEPEADDQ